MTVQAFIFDLDGVITDTAEYHYRAWRRLAEEEGFGFTREDNEQLRGISRRQSLGLILRGRCLPEGKIQALLERKNSYYLQYVQDISARDLLPGARELLVKLREHGLKTALASSSKNARAVLARLEIGHLFDAVADGNSVAKAKPHPDLFLFAAAALGAEPQACVVVEDAAAGIAAARAAGMWTVGIGPPERVGEADYVYPSVAAIRLEEILY